MLIVITIVNFTIINLECMAMFVWIILSERLRELSYSPEKANPKTLSQIISWECKKGL